MPKTQDVLLNDIGGTGFFALMAENLGGRRKGSRRTRPAAPAPKGGVTTALRLMTEAEARGNDTEAYTAVRPYADEDRKYAVVRAKTALWMSAGYVGAAVLLTGVLKIVEGVANPLQTAVYAVAGALVAAIAWRNAWRVLVSHDVPSVLDTPPYAVKANPEPADNLVPLAPRLAERCARVLR